MVGGTRSNPAHAFADPRLSIVATSRNDDHGGNLQLRTQLFINGAHEQAERFGVSTEVILVEWNPPSGRPSLAESLVWPSGDHVTFRVITVAGDVHRTFDHSDILPLFQMIAKNAGIRRAKAPLVLATNVDIVFSDPLYKFLGGALDSATLYRCDRIDVDAALGKGDVPLPSEVRGLPFIRANRKDGVYYEGRGRVLPAYQSLGDWALFQAKVLLSRKDPNIPGWKAAAAPERSSPSTGPLAPTLNWILDKSESLANLTLIPRIHANACGDFTLMASDDWSLLRGYPEWPVFSWHLDSFLLYQALAAGIAIRELPADMHVIHLEHSGASGWTPEAARGLFARLDRAGVPYLTDRDLGRWAKKLLRHRGSSENAVINPPDWGLVDFDLPETVNRS